MLFQTLIIPDATRVQMKQFGLAKTQISGRTGVWQRFWHRERVWSKFKQLSLFDLTPQRILFCHLVHVLYVVALSTMISNQSQIHEIISRELTWVSCHPLHNFLPFRVTFLSWCMSPSQIMITNSSWWKCTTAVRCTQCEELCAEVLWGDQEYQIGIIALCHKWYIPT